MCTPQLSFVDANLKWQPNRRTAQLAKGVYATIRTTSYDGGPRSYLSGTLIRTKSIGTKWNR
jgi:hypothetical protein